MHIFGWSIYNQLVFEENEFKNIFGQKYLKNFNENNLLEYLKILKNFNPKNFEKKIKELKHIIQSTINEELCNFEMTNQAQNAAMIVTALPPTQVRVQRLFSALLFIKSDCIASMN